MHSRTTDFKQNHHKAFSTIRARILLITISLIVMVSAIVILISYFIISSNLQQSLVQTSETRLSFLCSSIDSNVDNVKGFVRSCQVNNKVKKFALEESSSDNLSKREAHDVITESYTSNYTLRAQSQLIRMVIIGNARNEIIQIVESPYSSIAVSADVILSLPYFNLLHEHPEEAVTGIEQDPFIYTKEIPMIPFLYIIEHPYTADEIGYIFTEMSTSVITEPVHNFLSETDSTLYFKIGDLSYRYQDGALTSSNDSYEITNDLSSLALMKGTSICRVKNTDGHGTAFLITRPLETSGWYVTEYIDETQLTKSILHTFLLITLIIVSACSAIGLLLSWFLSKTVNVPVRLLQIRMERIKEGDFSRDPSTEWDHELGDIGKTINDLSENVLSLMNQRIEDEKQKKDYEYRMLQSQINPHFLYNTLNSIKWMATIQNAPGIAEMTTALSHLLKDISKGTTNLITIEHELSLIKDYFTIQQYRYGGTITLSFTIEDKSLTDYQILKFTLQPLVENAIFHGIEPKGTAGSIVIHIFQDEYSDIHIDVTDDGIGIEPELAEHLLEKESPASSSFFREIGISNVHKRLQYEFGTKYGLSITSKKGEFTTISVLLPNRKNKEID